MADGDKSVTLALINAKLDTVIERLGEFQASQDEQELRIRGLEQNGARLKERVGLLGGGLAILQIILAAVAAAIGVRK